MDAHDRLDGGDGPLDDESGRAACLGLLLLASMLAALGYLTVRGLWSVYLRRAWHARRRRSRAS